MIETILQRYLTEINLTIENILSEEASSEPGYNVMLEYAMGRVDAEGKPYSGATGKRLRPIFLLLCAEASGGEWKKALPAAAAVEILHNFSLIHDDIQDDSDIRHSRPTLWKVWGKANAINAGDALFALAYAALSRLKDSLSPEQTLEIWRMFNKTNLELTRGQHLDMRFESLEKVQVEEYISMIRGKTAALLAASAWMGGYIATGNQKQADHLAEFGLNIGIAFQIRDDILGIWGDSAVTGKSAASDILSRKKSLPILYGLSKSPDFMAFFSQPSTGDDNIARAVQMLDKVQAKEFAIQQEKEYYARAMTELGQAQIQSKTEDLMNGFVDFLFSRQY